MQASGSIRVAPVFLIVVAAISGAELRGATRMTYNVANAPVEVSWSASRLPIPYQVTPQLAELTRSSARDLAKSFTTWESVEGAAVRFRYEGIASGTRARDGKNLITTTDALFENSGFIAFTTTWFNDRGEIEEADIQLDTGKLRNGADLQSVLQHEIGHLLGLDHSAVLSSTMYPFVGERTVPLDSDDRLAIAEIYPGGSNATLATIEGIVTRSGALLEGAHVVAVDESGAAVVGDLSRAGGSFHVRGLAPGDYRLYVEPLDGPVEPRNFSNLRGDSSSPFRSGSYPQGQTIRLRAGEVRDYGVLDVDPLPPTLNARWIGSFPVNGTEIKLSTLAASVDPGSTVSIAVGGDGIVGGMTSFEFIGSGVERISEFQYGSNFLWASFKISPALAGRSLVVLVRSGNETAMLSGGLRVSAGAPRRRGIQR